MSTLTQASATTQTATLLPAVNVMVDAAEPTKSFPGAALTVSAEQSKAQKIGYLQFDLSPIPPGADITAAWFVFDVVDEAPLHQVVVVGYVPSNDWSDTITFDTAPKTGPSVAGGNLATWMVLDDTRVTTFSPNPALVAQLKAVIGGGASLLSVQLSSTFGQVLVSNTYQGFDEQAAAASASSAARLVVQYTPARQPLRRNWNQPLGDARHTGRTEWRFANTPASSYDVDALVQGTQLSSGPVVANDLLYYFTPTTLERYDPSASTQHPSLRTGLASFATAALGPNNWLYAIATTELMVFDLANGATTVSSATLTNARQLSVDANGAAYVVDGTVLSCFTPRLGRLALSWQQEVGSAASMATVDLDASTVYIASAAGLSALRASDGTVLWQHEVTPAPTHVTTPVVSPTSGLVFVGFDDTLLAFDGNTTPANVLAGSATVDQPVADSKGIIHVMQGGDLFTVSADGETKSAQVTVGAASPVDMVLDGNDNLYVIDAADRLWVFDGAGAVVVKAQSLATNGRRSGLALAPDGSIYLSAPSELWRVRAHADDVVAVDGFEDATSYRAASQLQLAGAAVPAGASVLFESAGSISVAAGFSIPTGTTVAFRNG